MDSLEVLCHGKHVVVGDMEVGIVVNLDGVETFVNQTDAVVVSCVGSIGRAGISVGIGIVIVCLQS